jgi:hypothetical protein
MRVLIYGDVVEDSKDYINYFKTKLFANVDIFDDLDEAAYCLEIRHYDLVVIEYIDEWSKKYLSIFKSIKEDIETNPTLNRKIFFYGDDIDKLTKYDFITETFKELNVFEQIKKYYPLEKELIIEKDGLKVDLKNKRIVYINDNNKEVELEFFKKIDFYVILYFMRNYQSIINIDHILEAVFEEPELTTDSKIESSISSIRSTFKTIGDLNPIKSFKKVGYKFSL